MRGEAESPGQMPQVKANSGIYRGNETVESASREKEGHLWAVGICWEDRHCGSIRGLAVIRLLQE